MKEITPVVGKGCCLVEYFDGDEYVTCGQYKQAADAGVHAAKLIGTTPLDNVRVIFNIELAGNGE